MTTIRQATTDDLENILTIYNEIILHTTAIYQYEIHTLEMRREWFNLKQEQGYPVFVAEDGSVLKGFSTIGPFRNWQAYKYSVENSVYVAAEYRGQGIGKLLLQPLIDAAIKMDMHTIIAGIDATNETSLALHRNFGFKDVALFKQVGYKFDRWLDLAFLQLLLDTPLNPIAK